jgi:hypothetical protein
MFGRRSVASPGLRRCRRRSPAASPQARAGAVRQRGLGGVSWVPNDVGATRLRRASQERGCSTGRSAARPVAHRRARVANSRAASRRRRRGICAPRGEPATSAAPERLSRTFPLTRKSPADNALRGRIANTVRPLARQSWPASFATRCVSPEVRGRVGGRTLVRRRAIASWVPTQTTAARPERSFRSPALGRLLHPSERGRGGLAARRDRPTSKAPSRSAAARTRLRCQRCHR